MGSEAWVTLATNDTYALGALVLGRSLRRVQTTKKLHCIITNGVTDGMRSHLSSVFDEVSEVNVLDSQDSENLALIGRPDLGVTFTKLHCWRLTQYQKCVFLDADTLVLQNSDELFSHEEFSAAPDIGWPDIFNSGVFVFSPSVDTYRALIQTSLSEGSFDGGDQGLLNSHFHDWRQKGASHRLSFVYNMSSSAVYSYTAAYKKFAKDVKIVHFLGAGKPWHARWGPGGLEQASGSTHLAAHLQYWWSVYIEDVHSSIDPNYSLLNEASARACREFLLRCGYYPGQRWSHVALYNELKLIRKFLVARKRRRSRKSSNRCLKHVVKRATSPFCASDDEEWFYGSDKSEGLNPSSSPEITKSEEEDSDDYSDEEAPASTMAAYGSFSHLPTVNICAGWIKGGAHVEVPDVFLKADPSGRVSFQLISFDPNQNVSEEEEVGENNNNGASKIQGLARIVRKLSQDSQGLESMKFAVSHASTSSPSSQSQMIGGAGAAVYFSEPRSDADHRRAVEAGKVDYMGRDSWENIQKRLDKSLGLD